MVSRQDTLQYEVLEALLQHGKAAILVRQEEEEGVAPRHPVRQLQQAHGQFRVLAARIDLSRHHGGYPYFLLPVYLKGSWVSQTGVESVRPRALCQQQQQQSFA